MSENYSPKPSKNTTILLVMLGVVAALLVFLIISTNLATEEPDEQKQNPVGNLQTGDTQNETPSVSPVVSYKDKILGISLYKGPTLQYNIKYDEKEKRGALPKQCSSGPSVEIRTQGDWARCANPLWAWI